MAVGAGLALGGAAARFAPGLVRSRDRRLLWGLAAVAAVVAVLAPGEPTGLAGFDDLLRALTGAALVLAGARARPWFAVGSAALLTAVAAGISSPDTVVWTGAAALGLGIAHALTAGRGRAAVALVIVALVHVGFRLEPSATAPSGAATLLSAAGFAPVVYAGLTRMRRSQLRLVGRGVLVVAGVTGLAAALAAVAVVLAKRPLEAGVDALEAGIDAARATDQVAASDRLRVASGEFADAEGTLTAWWTAPGRLVPIVAQHLVAVRAAAVGGHDLAAAGADAVSTADLGGLRVRGGSVDLAALAALDPSIRSAAATLSTARERLAAAQSPWLLDPVRHPLDRQLRRLTSTEREARLAVQAVQVLPGLLGAEGERRYFLAVQTPAELRGSGGILGSYGLLRAAGGKVDVVEFGSDGDLNTAGAPPARRTLGGPPDYRARYGASHPERIWQNVTLAPDFPTVATVIADLYPQSGGAPVDGVLSMDPKALAAILRLIGPVDVTPWPEPITADNAEQVLLFDQYVRLGVEPRKVFLADVAEAVARKFTSVDLPPPRDLVTALAPVVDGHHLMLTSHQPDEQALFTRVWATGALPRAATDAGDSLAVISQNAGGNKIDWYLRRSTTYEVQQSADGRSTTAKLRIELRNESPAAGVPDYIIGNLVQPPVPRGTNRQILSIYSPRATRRLTIDGVSAPVSTETETGRHVSSVVLAIPPGATTVVEVDLGPAATSGDDSYRLAVHRQPLVAPETLAVRVNNHQVVRPAPLLADERLKVHLRPRRG